MRILAVARFTCLRLWRTRYVLSGALLVLIVVGTYLLTTVKGLPGQVGDVHWPYSLARLMTWVIAIWLGLNLIHNDLADGTTRSTLTRPISLIEYVLGKLLAGLAAIVAFSLAVALALIVAALVRGASFQSAMALYPLVVLPGHLMVLAVSMLLAQVLPRFAAGVLTLAAREELYSARALSDMAGWMPYWLLAVFTPVAKVLYWLCPPTQLLYIGYDELARGRVDFGLWFLLAPYAVHYALAACLATTWLIGRKEL